MKSKSSFREALTYIFLFILALAFLAPIAIIIMNSVKGNFYISQSPFSIPNYETFVGAENFIKGFKQSDFMKSFFNSAFITFFSVAGIVLMTSMTAWFIVRVKNKLTKLLYYLFVFALYCPSSG